VDKTSKSSNVRQLGGEWNHKLLPHNECKEIWFNVGKEWKFSCNPTASICEKRKKVYFLSKCIIILIFIKLKKITRIFLLILLWLILANQRSSLVKFRFSPKVRMSRLLLEQ